MAAKMKVKKGDLVKIQGSALCEPLLAACYRAVLAAVGVVTESPLVEEVFADDLLLRKAFRKALGRG